VEAPITDWLQEAYEASDVLATTVGAKRARSRPKAGPKNSTVKAAQKIGAARKAGRR
jgi:hypothetical protein